MSRAVNHVLAQRAKGEGRRPEAMSLGAALLLHALLVGAALGLPRLQPPPPQLEFVPVTVLPAQALGVRRPAPARSKPAPPAPQPEPVQEEPAAPEAPAPEPPAPKPREEAPVLPEETPKKPETRPEKKPEAKPAETGRKPADSGKKPSSETGRDAKLPTPKPAEPRPAGGTAGTQPGGTGDQAGRQGAATGSSTGTSAFGSEIAGLDNPDFTYGYYIDRLLSLIDANWVRPNMGSGVRAIISFRIQKDGSLSELRVAESSGYNAFDLAALRAVQNASPFPPLPRAYRHDNLGVNLIVR